MSLEHGILGFLSIRPGTGYDLKKMLDSTGTRFWTAEHPQIYKALKALEKRHWITIKEITPGKKLEKKVYELTPEGGKELVRWLKNEDYSAFRIKNPIVMQCFFSSNLSLDDRLLLVDRYYREAKRMDRIFSDSYEKKSRELGSASPEERRNLSPLHKLFRYNMMSNQTFLKWLGSCRKELQEERRTNHGA